MATWYVDNAASGTNAGTSWTNAWESFADIVWSTGGVIAGDTLMISGGDTSKTYTGEELLIGASGTSGNILTVMGSEASGHDGQVIIDGDETAMNGVRAENRSYVTIKNLRIINCIGTSRGHFNLWSTTYVTVDNCEILNLHSGHGGFIGWNPDHVTVQNCKCTTATGTTHVFEADHFDPFYFLFGNDVTIDNCFAGNYSDYDGSVSHNDSIIYERINNGVIKNCFVDCVNNKTYDSQGMWDAYPSGTHYIYNNIIYAPNTYSSVFSFRNAQGTDRDPDTFGVGYIFNNTIIGSGVWNTFWLDGVDCFIKNNAIWGLGGSAFSQYYRQPVTIKSSVDYNRYYYQTSYAYPFSHVGGPYNFSGWQGLGYDIHGGSGNIEITLDRDNETYSIAATSSLIEAGVNLTSLGIFTTDRNGNARPATGAWTVGALEYDGSPPVDPEDPPNEGEDPGDIVMVYA